MSLTLRTEEGERLYQEHIKNGGNTSHCPLCTELALQTFKYWKIMPNSFPYDRIASEHHMLVPIRHVKEAELNQEELAEMKEIKENVLNANYQYILEATLKQKSIPAHFHLHVIKLREHLTIM